MFSTQHTNHGEIAFAQQTDPSVQKQIKHATQDIKEVTAFGELLKNVSFQSMGVFDLDNTIFRPAKQFDLGSDQWFCALFEHARAVLPGEEAIQSCVAMHHSLQKYIPVKPVESNIKRIIDRLKPFLPVVALTARGGSAEIIQSTLSQLQTIDIHFTQHGKQDACLVLDVQDPKKPNSNVFYCNGVIFCDGADKGLCLLAFLKHFNLHPCVTMMDDTKSNLEKVLAVLQKENIAFNGLHYRRLNERVSAFQMEKTYAPLARLFRQFSDAEKKVVEDLKLVDKLPLASP